MARLLSCFRTLLESSVLVATRGGGVLLLRLVLLASGMETAEMTGFLGGRGALGEGAVVVAGGCG